MDKVIADQCSTEHSPDKLSFSVVAYTLEERKAVTDMLAQLELDQFLNIHLCVHCSGMRPGPGKDGKLPCKNCDMAVIVLGKPDDPEIFIQDLAHMKLVEGINAVIALVDPQHENFINERRGDILSDDLLYFPVNRALLSKKIRTFTASIKLDQSRKKVAGIEIQHIGQLLVESGLITPLELKRALDYQRQEKVKLGEALVRLGVIDEEQRIRVLSGQLGVPVATAQQYAAADMNVVALIPERIARQYRCIALERVENTLHVVMTDVLDLKLLDLLRDQTECTISPILGVPRDIETSLERYYRDITTTRDASVLMADINDTIEFKKEESDDELDVQQAAAAGAELGIIRLVNMALTNAVRDRASDIHIEPMEHELVIRYRIDGELRRVMSPPARSHQAIISRIKILSNLNIAERRLPQDGRMAIKLLGREVDVRVSILPTIFGEKAVLRILDKAAFEHNINQLGFSDAELEIFRSQISRPYGMVIVTGPTGSGKSTTLYSAIQGIKTVARNIITVEDPVEFHIDGISQVQANAKIGLSFAAALRSILRQDPDIILIGEIRDAETADIAIKMSLTGHMVYSTLHTNDAASAIARFTDIGVAPLLLASSLNLVIAQRLVRRLCTHCKHDYTPDPALVQQLHLDDEKVKFFKGEGCVRCNGTGFLGRRAVFEMLRVSPAIATMILRNAATQEIQDQAQKEGMRTLRASGLDLALRGETTIEQVLAVTTDL